MKTQAATGRVAGVFTATQQAGARITGRAQATHAAMARIVLPPVSIGVLHAQWRSLALTAKARNLTLHA